MKKLVIARTASKEIIAIWKFIAKDSIDAADRVRDEIEAEMHRLCEMPGLGHERAEVKNKDYRFWAVYSYLIVYRVQGERLCVARVVHGARNLRRTFRRWRPKR